MGKQNEFDYEANFDKQTNSVLKYDSSSFYISTFAFYFNLTYDIEKIDNESSTSLLFHF